MKHPVPLCLLTIASIVPMRGFAHDAENLTRSQVREELAVLEQRGYNPGDWVHYPQSLRTAQTRPERTSKVQSGDDQPADIRALQAE
jgi:Domain of unknown function (DUF4148)